MDQTDKFFGSQKIYETQLEISRTTQNIYHRKWDDKMYSNILSEYKIKSIIIWTFCGDGVGGGPVTPGRALTLK